MLGDFGVLIDDIVLVPAVLGLAEELRGPRLFRIVLERDDQVPEVGPDRVLGGIHAQEGDWKGKPAMARINVPPLTAILLEWAGN